MACPWPAFALAGGVMERLLANIPEALRVWKAEMRRRPEAEVRLEQWLFINAAGVLLGEKPGELLTLRLDEFGLEERALEAHLARCGEDWGFQARILQSNAVSFKLLVFNTQRLAAILEEAPLCILEGKLGYSLPLRVESFIGELSARWREGDRVPHEVGILLGYPFDDVFGFMGLLPLPCQGTCGWQVYGCLHEARRRSGAYTEARCRALAFLAA
jgi:hypothetical protein